MRKQSDIDMDQCYVTNATLCKPPAHKKAFVDDFPTAIQSCIPRLEAEIAAVRPRMILVLGTPALVSLTGYDVPKAHREPIECNECDENRRVGPALQCSAPSPTGEGACGHLHHFVASTVATVDPDELAKVKATGCPACGAKFKNARPKMIKCPSCGGRKSRMVEGFVFEWDYSIGDVAGAIFTPAPPGEPRQGHHVNAWFGEQGVQYVVGTYHPSFILRDQQFIAEAVLKHFAKVKRLLDGGKPRWKLNYSVTSDPKVVRDFVYGWKAAGTPAPKFELDIESDPKIDADGKAMDARYPPDVGKITVIGIGTTESTLVVDTRACDPANAADPLLAVIADFLCDPEIPKCWHNGACYDIPTLDLVWGVPAGEQIKGYADDTLAMHSCLYPDEPHKLSHVAFSFTDAFAWKPPRTANGVEVHKDFAEHALYNARDVYNTSLSREVMAREIKTHKLQKVDEIDREIRKLAVKMTMAGLPINLEKRAEEEKRVKKQVDEAYADLVAPLERCKIQAVDGVFNPKSSQQLSKVLFSKEGFGLKPLGFTKTGAPETGEAIIHAMAAINKDPDVHAFLMALLAHREHSKTWANYFMSHEAQPWAIDGRIHSFWKPWGARTGRFSSVAINEQNIPKWMRAMFETADGRVIVGADYDQLELRGVAALAGDPVLIHKCMTADDQRKLEPEHDPHSYVAQLAFGSVYTGLLLKDPTHDKKDVKCKCQTCKRKALRDLIKRVIYGLNYGSGDKTVLEAIYSKGDYNGPPIDLSMIAHVRKTIFAAFTQIAPWQEDIIAEAKATCELRSPLHGRRRVFPLNDIPVTEAKNFPVQSFAADLINEKIIELDRRLPEVDPSAFIMAQVHDAVYIEASEGRGDAVAQLQSEVLTCDIVLREGAPAMRFSASGSVARNWRDAA
jgi:DNA polymerase I-like protein with 3'-5' exonuclease and polymerase domains/uracil-DNA glycosylase